TTLCIKEFKEFQIKTIDAIAHGNDVILVQPTGSGKSLCFTVPALLNPRKVCIVIEPVVAIINNQVEALQKKH
ncbi:MAG: DEAD/DEAH box helicase, partial [Acidobacteria bacterium]|nr:DEAD/DEAH box helicase [Acidobacteriota bacterium]